MLTTRISFNVFRLSADLSHVASKCILIWAIHNNKSAEGVSMITQSLYCLVFLTRYLDLLWRPPSESYYLFLWKVFYIATSIYILALMQWVFPRSREREKAYRLGFLCLVACFVGAPFVNYMWYPNSPSEILRTFSLILESICVLPQLMLLRQTTVPTVIDSYYLVTLGAYRALYILNWIYRFFTDHIVDPPAVVFGILQTVLYVDFAWIYYSRQRVKLRGGGLIDYEDVQQGWLLRPVLGRKSASLDEERPVLLGDDDILAAAARICEEGPSPPSQDLAAEPSHDTNSSDSVSVGEAEVSGTTVGNSENHNVILASEER